VLALVSTFTPCCEVYAVSHITHALSDHGHDATVSHQADDLSGPCGHGLDNYHVSADLSQAALLAQKVDIGLPWLLAIGTPPIFESILIPLNSTHYSTPPPDAFYLLYARLLI
jgi:hypothetical protein